MPRVPVLAEYLAIDVRDLAVRAAARRRVHEEAAGLPVGVLGASLLSDLSNTSSWLSGLTLDAAVLYPFGADSGGVSMLVRLALASMPELPVLRGVSLSAELHDHVWRVSLSAPCPDRSQ